MASEKLPVESLEDAASPAARRVDAAHPVQRVEVPSTAPARVAAGVPESEEALDEFGGSQLFAAGTPAEALARHAGELAEKLQSRLQELDHRESILNGQEAELESRIRNARLWLDEQEQGLADRKELLDQREAEQMRAATSDAELGLSASSGEKRTVSAERHFSLDTRQVELEVAQTELTEKLSEFELQTALCRTKQEELTATRQAYEARQRDLDRREAELYKQIEQLTTTEVSLQQRTERIGAADSELTKRTDELRTWELKLGERSSELEFQRAELNRISQEVEFRLQDATDRERRIRFREQEIQTALQRFERLGITEKRMVELQERSNEFELRARNLSAAELLLAEQQEQLLEQRLELERQQLCFENHVRTQRKLLKNEKEETTLLLERREEALVRREGELNQREAALGQLQEELRSAQREVLEMRLATEETWLQLQGVLAPAALSRSVSQLRVRLADHFHLAAEEALRKRQQLEQVRTELSGELKELESQRNDLELWLNRRERDLQQHAARLIDREQELDAQQQHYETASKAWQAQRAELLQEIQRLLAAEREHLNAAA